MTKPSYRIVAPRAPRAVAIARVHGEGAAWLVAGLLALGLALATGAAHGTVLL